MNEKNILLKRETKKRNPDELKNIILTKEREDWAFLHIQLKITVKIHADILK